MHARQFVPRAVVRIEELDRVEGGPAEGVIPPPRHHDRAANHLSYKPLKLR